jgi:hypothetical protein
VFDSPSFIFLAVFIAAATLGVALLAKDFLFLAIHRRLYRSSRDKSTLEVFKTIFPHNK